MNGKATNSAAAKKAGGGILKASSYLLAITLAARLLSMVREMLLASRIGMNAYTDAFNVSQSAITFCTGTIGATCVALVPVLVNAAKEGEKRRDEVFTSLFVAYMAFSAVVALVLTLFAGPICAFLGPGMSADAQALAADLLRIGFIKINCVVGCSLFAYYLQSREIFITSGLATLCSSALVVALLFLNTNASIYDYTVYTVCGFVIQFVVPLPFLLKVKYRPRIRTLFESKSFKALVLASIPLMLSTMFFEVQSLVGRAILTSFGEGSASSLDYAYKVAQLLNASITMSLNTVLFTKIASSAARDDKNTTTRYLVIGARNQFLFLLPVMLIAVAFGGPLIALLFQRGAFTSADTANVYAVLLGYLLGVWPYVLADLFTKYYVTLGETRIINFVNGIGYCLSLAVVYPVALVLKAPGVSIAFSLAQLIIVIGFIVYFCGGTEKGLVKSHLREFLQPKDLGPALVLALLLLVCRTLLGTPGPWLALGLSAVMFAAYCGLLWAMHIKVGFSEID